MSEKTENKPSTRPHRWILASELWTATKDGRERILKPSLAWMRRAKADAGRLDDRPPSRHFAEPLPSGFPVHVGPAGATYEPGKGPGTFDGPKIVGAALLAAWVSFFPLAPQQAKREAVIATAEGSYVAGELVSRQRAARSVEAWFGPRSWE